MLYVIPFVILLAIALILKKRENAKNSNDTATHKKSKNQLHNKNRNRTEKTSKRVQEKIPVKAPIKSEQLNAPISEDEKSEIQNLIQNRRFLSAEAKINQALNQDSNQHDLFLFLFDIHIAQKDELATKHLLNHLRLLGLHEVIDQANQKLENSSWVDESASNTLNDKKLTTTNELNFVAEPSIENLGIIESSSARENTTTLAETLSEFELEKKETPKDIEPLEFTQPDLEQMNVAQSNSQTSKQSKSYSSDEIKHLEFNLDIAPSVTESNTQLSFTKTSFENEISFEQSNDGLQLESKSNFEFNLDTPISTTPEDLVFEEELNRSIQQTALQKIDLDSSLHTQDPLAQAFPQLLISNEIQLNFELAQKYIELGAYDAAKQLISEKANEYSLEQRHFSEKLLNQIAS